MAFVPGFEHDVFISYSHLDNQSVDKNNQVGRNGWVSAFHSRLQVALDQLLGADVDIWRDERLDSVVNFPSELSKQLRGTAVLLAVVSPGYLNSRWCEWELSGFVGGDQRTGDLLIDNRYRAVKVVKLPGDNESASRPGAARKHRARIVRDRQGCRSRLRARARLAGVQAPVSPPPPRTSPASSSGFVARGPSTWAWRRREWSSSATKLARSSRRSGFKVLRAPHEDAADAVDVIRARCAIPRCRFASWTGARATSRRALPRLSAPPVMRPAAPVWWWCTTPMRGTVAAGTCLPNSPRRTWKWLVDPPTHALNEDRAADAAASGAGRRQ